LKSNWNVPILEAPIPIPITCNICVVVQGIIIKGIAVIICEIIAICIKVFLDQLLYEIRSAIGLAKIPIKP
jgi:hypothetical protein